MTGGQSPCCSDQIIGARSARSNTGVFSTSPGLAPVGVSSAACRNASVLASRPSTHWPDCRLCGRAGTCSPVKRNRSVRFGPLAAGKPRVSLLVQLFQIGQTVHRQLLGIALTGGGEAFEYRVILCLESETRWDQAGASTGSCSKCDRGIIHNQLRGLSAF